MNDKCGIYIIKNDINDKVYIGQSINIYKRIQEHFYKSECNKDVSYNNALHSAIRKYGKEHFYYEILEECDASLLDEYEIEYINKYNSISPNGYNILSGGQQYRAEPNRCIDCNKIIYKYATRCKECDAKHQRKVSNRPSKFELAKLIVNSNFEEVGRQYGVNGNTIRKWCIAEGIPSKKEELIEWYKSQLTFTSVQDKIVYTKFGKGNSIYKLSLKDKSIIDKFASLRQAANSVGVQFTGRITRGCKQGTEEYGYYWCYENDYVDK